MLQQKNIRWMAVCAAVLLCAAGGLYGFISHPSATVRDASYIASSASLALAEVLGFAAMVMNINRLIPARKKIAAKL